MNNNADAMINLAEEVCNKHGARLTDKRKKVLAGLIKSEKALSAYELVDFCNKEFGETMPAMSVYRILEFLQEEHLVHKLKLSNKFVACAHMTKGQPHRAQFVICGQCQAVKEIAVDNFIIDALEKNIEKEGFHFASSQLEMNCLCEDCLSKGAAQQKS